MFLDLGFKVCLDNQRVSGNIVVTKAMSKP